MKNNEEQNSDVVNEEDDRLRVHITEDSFALKGRVPIEKKHVLILLAIIAAALGVSFDEIMSCLALSYKLAQVCNLLSLYK